MINPGGKYGPKPMKKWVPKNKPASSTQQVNIVVVVVVVVILVVVKLVVLVEVVAVAAVVVVKSFLSPNHGWCYSQTRGSTRALRV